MASVIGIFRAILFMLLTVILGLSVTAFVIAFYPILYVLDPEWKVAHTLCAGGVYYIGKLFFSMDVKGAENIPVDFHRIVIVSNHQSTLDMAILGYLYPQKFLVTFKKELLFYPGLGTAMYLARYLWVNRSDKESGRKLIQEAEDRVRAGGSVLFFPEGTRNVNSTSPLGPFKPGAFKVAVETGAKILPVTISGARKLFPSKGFPSLGFGRPLLIIHPVINSAGKTVEELRDATVEVIERGMRDVDTPKVSAQEIKKEN